MAPRTLKSVLELKGPSRRSKESRQYQISMSCILWFAYPHFGPLRADPFLIVGSGEWGTGSAL
ncbi:hypothetical protein VP1G_10543 [Cytospora mali]|uniref:Uncharacterized protein n=1 Tax=Cytospora mali TaxID=578113 RepID=A0A194UMJ8_CYTMA|nr:hypothetical protein VP1G_10543 [Valsa mali var. pyri (nom. inval.)]